MGSRRLALAARVAGLAFLLGGQDHFFGFARKAWLRGAREPHHEALLVFIGIVQVAGGALDLLGARGIARGERWGRQVAGVGCALALAFTAALEPVVYAKPLPFNVAPVLHGATHLALAIALVARRPR